MCGITGFVDASRRATAGELGETVRKMAQSLRHRGPDEQGTWVDPRHGIALGHRRLSIIDLSSAGHQPMVSACGRYVLIFNGEIYNFRDLRRELESEGERFQGHSDTEVMLLAIGRWGLDRAVEKFNGMFAFCLWDSHDGLLHLGRDRAGEKPLYYGWAENTFLFSSELKALRCHPSFSAEIDRGVLALFFRHNFVPGPYSIYKGIRKLPPAALLTVRVADRSCSMRSYWSLRQRAESAVRQPFRGTEDEALAELELLLLESVQLRMESDVPLGAFLSGGIDSSLVVAFMQSASSRPVKTFTIGFSDTTYDEAPFAKAVAQHLGTDHSQLYVNQKELLDVIPRLPAIYDEPFADSSQIPTFLVSRLARAAVTVSLSGDGGDELFGGYDKYLRDQKLFKRLTRMPRFARSAAGSLLASVVGLPTASRYHPYRSSDFPRGDIALKAQKFSAMLRTECPELFHWTLDSYWPVPNVLVPGGQEPETSFTDPNQWGQFKELLHTMMYLDTKIYLPDDILVKVDRAAMAQSLETRLPLLDHRVIEFSWKLPLAMKIDQSVGKKPLRQLLRKYLPDSLVNRPKKGFAVPLDLWLRGPLRPWAESLLDESLIQHDGYLCQHVIGRKWRAYKEGKSNSARLLWGILMFQSWLQEQKEELENASDFSISACAIPAAAAQTN